MSYFMHPRMMATINAGSFPNRGTIQQATETQDSVNQPIRTWSNVDGLTSLPCRIETTSGNETKAANQVYSTATHEIYFDGYYPQIDQKMIFVDEDSQIYDILMVNQDGFGTFTRLTVEVRH